jgi:hypothetical protein
LQSKEKMILQLDSSNAKRMEYNERVERGRKFAELVWWRFAKRILQIAGEHYKWDDDEWKAMTDFFLRPNDYKIIVDRR